MCGIAGLLDARRSLRPTELASAARDMVAPLRHRGPDDGGVWVSAAHRVALAHRRLSIVDLSPAGHQPMASADGRWIITLNGEVYNFSDLRGELEAAGARLRGESDTTVLLEAIAHWGIARALERSVGMFAFALWDDYERVLYVARDRMGEKPVYVGWVGGAFLFASELKALKAFSRWTGAVDQDAIAQYFRYGYVPEPRSVYAGITKVRPGTYIAIGADAPPGTAPVEHEYWSAAAAACAGAKRPFGGSEAEGIDRLDDLLRTTVRQQMVADVPLGAFLSGGVDSSTVVSLMAAVAPGRVRAYTIGFTDAAFDEAPRAREIASYLGAEHHALYVTPNDALELIPTLAGIYDEPYADSSQIPTLLVARLTRRHVTVALSGDGGDEVFGGYNRHIRIPVLWERSRRLPSWMRQVFAGALDCVPVAAWRTLATLAAVNGAVRREVAVSPDKARKLVHLLRARSAAECYAWLSSVCAAPELAGDGDALASLNPIAMQAPSELSDFTTTVQYLDLVTYLPGDILVKVDRACMAHSLESRAPFLDHRIVEFALSLPRSFRVRGGTGKWIVRELLARYVPPRLTSQPKLGFSVPLGAWLRGELREWAEDLLSWNALRRSDVVDAARVRGTWQRHLHGSEDASAQLWTVLMFQSWLTNEGSVQERSAAV